MREMKWLIRRVHPVSTYRCLYSQFTIVFEAAYTAIDAIQTKCIDVNGSDYVMHCTMCCSGFLRDSWKPMGELVIDVVILSFRCCICTVYNCKYFIYCK